MNIRGERCKSSNCHVTMAGGYAPSVPKARERMRDPPTFYVTVLLLHLASSVLCLIQTTSV
jgi:hypothetical protein